MMRVGVLTYNVIRSLRDALLDRTLESVESAFPNAEWHLCDNGSDDGSDRDFPSLSWRTRGLGWFFHRRPLATLHTPGAGRNHLMRVMAPFPNDIIVLSDDDIVWKKGADTALRWFWDEAPQNVVLASGLMEPEYPWSQPIGKVAIGGLAGLIRPSLPAAAWSFRARDWDKIGPLKETVGGDGEDFAACKKLMREGHLLVSLDLCEHIGDGYSQCGNDEARRLAGRPIDKKEWGLS